MSGEDPQRVIELCERLTQVPEQAQPVPESNGAKLALLDSMERGASQRDPALLPPLHEIERRYILQVMEAVQGNKRRAARVLALDIKTLRRKLERYGFTREDVKRISGRP